jgi:hypothetical protein
VACDDAAPEREVVGWTMIGKTGPAGRTGLKTGRAGAGAAQVTRRPLAATYIWWSVGNYQEFYRRKYVFVRIIARHSVTSLLINRSISLAILPERLYGAANVVSGGMVARGAAAAHVDSQG